MLDADSDGFSLGKSWHHYQGLLHYLHESGPLLRTKETAEDEQQGET